MTRLAACAIAAICAATSAFADDPIVIGDVNAYTALPNHTEPYKKGAELAVEQINAAGGALGRPLSFVSRDSKAKPADAVTAAQELVAREGAVLLTGTTLSNVGLAVADYAARRKVLFVAAEPLSDAITWSKGNRYTFRLRPSTYMQTGMLAREAAAMPAKRWATIAPNYAYGRDAVDRFQKQLSALRPDVEFVAAQWPTLFKIDAGAESQALLAAEPEAVFSVLFGPDLQKFVREARDRGLMDNREFVGLLTGEPEYLEPLGAEAPEGWLVTGYPWYGIETYAHRAFVQAYRARWEETPRLGSLVGYNAILAIHAMLERAGTTETEAMVDALKDLSFDSPVGEITFRGVDHQATMGAFVGRTALQDGGGVMVDWRFVNGADVSPPEPVLRRLRVE